MLIEVMIIIVLRKTIFQGTNYIDYISLTEYDLSIKMIKKYQYKNRFKPYYSWRNFYNKVTIFIYI